MFEPIIYLSPVRTFLNSIGFLYDSSFLMKTVTVGAVQFNCHKHWKTIAYPIM